MVYNINRLCGNLLWLMQRTHLYQAFGLFEAIHIFVAYFSAYIIEISHFTAIS